MKPIAYVTNNNQPGWVNLVETAPNVTLPIGTPLYHEDDVNQFVWDLSQLFKEHGEGCNGSIDLHGRPCARCAVDALIRARGPTTAALGASKPGPLSGDSGAFRAGYQSAVNTQLEQLTASLSLAFETDGLAKVLEFQQYFGIPMPEAPMLMDNELCEYRVKFLREELNELLDAHNNGDLVAALDALVDLQYVLFGTVLLMGLESVWTRAFDIVHQCNMAKERVPSAKESKRGHAYDVRKPPGWTGPENKLRWLLSQAWVPPIPEFGVLPLCLRTREPPQGVNISPAALREAAGSWPRPPAPGPLAMKLTATYKEPDLPEPTKPSANDTQVGGSHYKDRAIEPWDFAWANKLDPFEAAVVKYVTRWKDKGGVNDLRKAIHYLQKRIELELMEAAS